MILPIVTYPDERLTRESERVTHFDIPLRKLATDMGDTMIAANGVGLAACQVGVMRRLILVDPCIKGQDKIAMANPRITRKSTGENLAEEGCLSIPGLCLDVWRHDWVVVEYQTLRGERRKRKCEGMLARVVQHEVDHLNGILFTRRANAEHLLEAMSRLQDAR